MKFVYMFTKYPFTPSILYWTPQNVVQAMKQNKIAYKSKHRCI